MKTLLIVAVAVIVVVSGALAVVNLALDRTEVRTYAISEPVRAIVVKADSGDVRLIRAAGKTVDVRETRHFILKRPKLDRDVAGGVLTLDSRCNGLVLSCSADLRVTVPAGVEVTVDSDSGNVNADEIAVSGAH